MEKYSVLEQFKREQEILDKVIDIPAFDDISLLYDLYINKGYGARFISKITCNGYGAINAKIRQYGLAKLRKGM